MSATRTLRDAYWQMFDLHERACQKRKEDRELYLDLAARALAGEVTDAERQLLTMRLRQRSA